MRPAAGVRDLADPIASRLDWLVGSFTHYLRWYFARNFHAVRVSRGGLPDIATGRPLIVYANHPSWWDPALFFVLNRALLPERRSFGPMDAEALGRYGLFRRLGVFGIEPGPRGAARFLRVSEQILSDPANALWITAEGVFTDARQRPIVLRPGLAHLARRTPGAVILPLAVEYPFWYERKPEALARFGPSVPGDPACSVEAWNVLLSAELARTMDALAGESATRDPSMFLTLHRGIAGVGGVYDGWRRARALLAGRRFDASHQREDG